jgi:hypothetical protein
MSEHQLTPISPIFDLFNNPDKCQPRISGSVTKASKNLIIYPITMSSRRKSPKTSKPTSNHSANRR